MSLLPAIPRIPPLWRESRIGLEAAALRRSPVYGGLGVPPGERRPVLLIPGFMAGDLSLGTMSSWLRRAGYCTHRTGIRANFACSEEACERLEARLEHMAERHGERVTVIGQSRGGVFAKALAARRPELVEGIVTLGSPTVSQLDVHPLVLAQVGLVSALGSARVPGMFRWSCLKRRMLQGLPRRDRGPVPGGRRVRRALLQDRRHRQLARLRRPRGRRARACPHLPLRHERQRPGLPRRGRRAAPLPRRGSAARGRPPARCVEPSTAALRGSVRATAGPRMSPRSDMVTIEVTFVPPPAGTRPLPSRS